MEGRDVDPSKPSIARLDDYILGGKQHFEVDRRAARHLYDVDPAVTANSRALLCNGTTTAVVTVDVREPAAVFLAAGVGRKS